MTKKDLRPPWKPGESGNKAGRPKGSRNKLGEQFIADLYADWTAHGATVIEKVRNEQPAAYLKVVASLMPRELNVKSEPLFDGMDDGQLAELIESVRREIVARTPNGSVDGEQKASGG